MLIGPTLLKRQFSNLLLFKLAHWDLTLHQVVYQSIPQEFMEYSS